MHFINIYTGGGYSLKAAVNPGNINFYTANAMRMQIAGSGLVSIGNFGTAGGTSLNINVTPQQVTTTTSLQVPGTGVYLLSGCTTAYNSGSWGSSNVWGCTVITPYISGYATATGSPPVNYSGTSATLYSSNMVIYINATGYVVIYTPAGTGVDTFQVNYIRIA